MDEMQGRDLYVRFNKPGNPPAPIQCVRVWDAEKYLTAREHEGTNAKKPEDRFTVSVATRDEYMAQQRM